MFKLKSLTNVLCIAATLASSGLAQQIFIAAPAPGTTVSAATNFTVQLDKPMTISSSEEVAVVIGALPCGSNGCPSPADDLGYILYNGPFNPQLSVSRTQSPSQNFTVALPAVYSGGPVQIGVVHVSLVGAGSSAELRFLNTTINVV